MDYAGFDGTPHDAPTSDDDLRPFASLNTMNTWNQQVQLPTTIAEGKKYIKTSMNLLMGMEKKDIRCVRNSDNKKLIHIHWVTRLLGTEAQIKQEFSDFNKNNATRKAMLDAASTSDVTSLTRTFFFRLPFTQYAMNPQGYPNIVDYTTDGMPAP